MNDLYYRYTKTKTVNKYFEQQRKVYEMMKLYKETENKNLLNKIIRLCVAQTNTVILNTLRDKQIMELMMDILTIGNNYKVGNATSILIQLSKTYRDAFFQIIEEIPHSFSKLIYHFDQISIYQMFNSFYEDKDNQINSFTFICYWIFALNQSAPLSISRILFDVDVRKSLKQDVLETYKKNVDFFKLINEKPFAFINFFRTLSHFCKKFLANPLFKPYQDLLVAASQLLFYPFAEICKPSSSKRGTIKDDCVSTLLDLYINLPRDKYVYYNCLDILRNHFYGSRLAVTAITYITNNIRNAAMNSFDFDLLSISVPFRIFYINEDYLYFTNVDDPVKTRLIDESKPNNMMMQVGLEYIKSLIRTSGNKILQTKKNLINSVLVLWYNSANCVLVKPDAKLVQTYLLKICLLIGDDLRYRPYHTLYQEIAVPFSKCLIEDSQEDDKPKNSYASKAASIPNIGPLNFDFKKRWKAFDFELNKEQLAFFDNMIEELDQLLKDSYFNFNTDFQFPCEEEEEEEDN